MAAIDDLRAFAQSVTLVMTGKYMDNDDLIGDEGTQFITELIDWTNQFIDDFELEADWVFARQPDATIGTIASPNQTFTLPVNARKLVVDELRPLRILQGGIVVSNWDVVEPGQISTQAYDYPYRPRASWVNNQIIFSRPFNTNEISGTVVADVINNIPRLSLSDTAVLTTIKPKRLLTLGVGKDITLPSFVRGTISPSLAQKYTDLLEKRVAENDATATSMFVERDNYGSIGGVGF